MLSLVNFMGLLGNLSRGGSNPQVVSFQINSCFWLLIFFIEKMLYRKCLL